MADSIGTQRAITNGNKLLLQHLHQSWGHSYVDDGMNHIMLICCRWVHSKQEQQRKDSQAKTSTTNHKLLN